jgi:hypothetical protein
LDLEKIFHDLSNKVARKNTPFENLTELNFDSVDLEWIERFFSGLFGSAFDDLKDSDVFVLRFDHKVIFSDGS